MNWTILLYTILFIKSFFYRSNYLSRKIENKFLAKLMLKLILYFSIIVAFFKFLTFLNDNIFFEI